MGKCQKCNANVPDGAQFCPSCGAKYTDVNRCPSCGQQLPPNAKFCIKCGAKIDGTQRAVAAIDSSNKAAQPSLKTYKSNNSNGKFVIGIIAIVVILAGIVAFVATHEDKQSEVMNNANSSTMSPDSSAIADTIAIEYPKEEKYYGDGATFDVKGKVKQITITNEEGWYTDKIAFDANCKYIPSDEWDIVERNRKGQIQANSVNDNEGYNSRYEYASDGKVLKEHIVGGTSRVTLFQCDDDEDEVILQYEYEGDNVSGITATYRFNEGNYIAITNPKSFSEKLNVEILSTDSKGNWTKRKITGNIITIEENGFEVAGLGYTYDECETEMYYSKKQVSIIEKRNITYYGE